MGGYFNYCRINGHFNKKKKKKSLSGLQKTLFTQLFNIVWYVMKRDINILKIIMIKCLKFTTLKSM